LQNLTTDIQKQMDAFFAQLGFRLKWFLSDFDTKLIGGPAREYLNSLHIHVNAAPANFQDKNGLAEHFASFPFDCFLLHVIIAHIFQCSLGNVPGATKTSSRVNFWQGGISWHQMRGVRT
jgi:hypothetical protein